MSGKCDDPEYAAILRHQQRRAAAVGDFLNTIFCLLGNLVAVLGDVRGDGFRRAFANLFAVEIHARHAGLRGERNKHRIVRSQFAPAQPIFLLHQHDDGAAFRCFVGERRELRGVGEFGFGDSGAGMKSGGLAIAERDRSGLVEQQDVHVAGSFDRAPRHGDDVALNHAIHAGDADGGEQSADGRGNQADQQGNQHEDCLRRARIDRKRLQRHDREQEDDRQSGEQNVERDFIRRFLPRGAFDQADHAIEKCFAGIRGDAHLDFVGEHARSAGDRGAVAAGFANYRSGFAGDRGFVDGGHAFDHFAVAGNEFAGRHQHDIAGAELGAGDYFGGAVGLSSRARVSARALRNVSACALPRPSAMASAKLAKSTVNHSHNVICSPKRKSPSVTHQVANQFKAGNERADFDDEHHGILDHRAGMQFAK